MKGEGVEHLGAVHDLAHTLLAPSTILCCMNTVKRAVLFGGNTGCIDVHIH